MISLRQGLRLDRDGRLLGCGLEKRPPCPRLTEFAGDAPSLRAGTFTNDTCEIVDLGQAIGIDWAQGEMI